MDELFWDGTLQRLGGNILQSWRWGEFKRRQGWTIHRLSEETPSGTWMAQILFKNVGPLSIAYVPCGPTLAGDHRAVFPRMMSEIDAICTQERAITLVMEPNQVFDLPGTFKNHGFVEWIKPFQPRLTMSIPVQDDQSMLAAMHHKTRYHIRLAQRQGIAVESRNVNQTSIAEFHALHAETVERNGLALLPIDYFTDLLAAFGDRAELLFSMTNDQPAAAALMVRFGNEANYLFAGSSKQTRGQGAGASLVFRSLQWAREHGCVNVDLGNISSEGLRDFKSGFGGVAHSFPTALDRRYRPVLAWGARRKLASKSI